MNDKNVPCRIGFMELLRTSSGTQFVIPVYQRNYTWRADVEVKQYLQDLEHVLKGDYKNHFMGILICLEKKINFRTFEFFVIDGQQRLTTTFLIVYAIREILKRNGDYEDVQGLDDNFLTASKQNEIRKLKLKPLVADDNVYKCIVEDRFDDIENFQSSVYKNYEFIKRYLIKLVEQEEYTANDILLALDKLYVVYVPISEEDNAQKIFESINATGVKLTAADLIRNYLLMNLDSDTQDAYYHQYWQKIEEKISGDSKDLEVFFRMFLAIKKYELVPKSNVYRNFVNWVEEQKVDTGILFQELLDYAKIYNSINKLSIKEHAKEIRQTLIDFRKIKSDLPISIVMEFFKLYNLRHISLNTLSQLVQAINIYLIRRSICDMSSQNISKLFPILLRRILEKCSGNYDEILDVLNQEMVGSNIGTSGSYMPTDNQMYDALLHANVYGRSALRIILERLELNNNSAPVDLSELSIEHLMPQKPKKEWLEELAVDEEKYMANLHRLGNLTLAAKIDNSKMSNQLWNFKNDILKNTAHLKMNMELLEISKWDIDCIEKRTKKLISEICKVFPYPNINMSFVTSKEGENILQYDTVKYSLNGGEFMNKREFVHYFISRYNNMTYAEIKEKFPDSILAPKYRCQGLVCLVEEYEKWNRSLDDKYKRYYHVNMPDGKLISADGKEFYVNSQWTKESIQKILEIAKEEGWSVKEKNN